MRVEVGPPVGAPGHGPGEPWGSSDYGWGQQGCWTLCRGLEGRSWPVVSLRPQQACGSHTVEVTVSTGDAYDSASFSAGPGKVSCHLSS